MLLCTPTIIFYLRLQLDESQVFLDPPRDVHAGAVATSLMRTRGGAISGCTLHCPCKLNLSISREIGFYFL